MITNKWFCLLWRTERLIDGDRQSFRIGNGQDLNESPDILTFLLFSIAARETHVIYLLVQNTCGIS